MKRMLIFLFIIMILMTGCVKSEGTVSHDPGPPHVCRMETASRCRTLLTAGNDETAIEILCVAAYDGGMLGSEDMEKRAYAYTMGGLVASALIFMMLVKNWLNIQIWNCLAISLMKIL